MAARPARCSPCARWSSFNLWDPVRQRRYCESGSARAWAHFSYGGHGTPPWALDGMTGKEVHRQQRWDQSFYLTEKTISARD